ncbi:E3 ubiquitin-protein ligase PUB23-like [Actinidia eriantha]|uniref:E3 ubiquitin-protein ligase PUB23-like n=1 Tax=Actinidia eriantha TaxID=165200 RepID=UPI00258BC057|nr:E3 ubiquitin-protein ligase PUB23-like [Actinidia eriantha]
MGEIEVPPFFLCPISLELMKDPVTVPTGITYDRESIEKWIFSEKNNTCPVTKQAVSDPDMITPNHTLRRLIQSWCILNAPHGVERVPTPKPPVTKSQITNLLKNATSSPHTQVQCLNKLRSMASASETNKRCIESAGGVHFLASLVMNPNTNNNDSASLLFDDAVGLVTKSSDDALSLLHFLQLSELPLIYLSKNNEFIDSLLYIMQNRSYESRAYAILLLGSMLEVAEPMQLIGLKPELFVEIVNILVDQISSNASKGALKLLINVVQWGRNRVKAVEAGAVTVLIDLLLDSPERRACEMIFMALDQMCQCAEGRAELLKHDAGLAVVSKKVLRVSKAASERAVRILLSVAKFSGAKNVVQEMLEVGVVAKLCLVLQVESGNKTKEKAREILMLHSRVWRNSSCVPMSLLASYPS